MVAELISGQEVESMYSLCMCRYHRHKSHRKRCRATEMSL